MVSSRLGRLGYEITSGVGTLIARVHANRLREIHDEAVQTNKPEEGAYPDCTCVLQRVRGTKEVISKSTGQRERIFKLIASRRGCPKWNRKMDLPEIVEKLFDLQGKEEADHDGSLELEEWAHPQLTDSLRAKTNDMDLQITTYAVQSSEPVQKDECNAIEAAVPEVYDGL